MDRTVLTYGAVSAVILIRWLDFFTVIWAKTYGGNLSQVLATPFTILFPHKARPPRSPFPCLPAGFLPRWGHWPVSARMANLVLNNCTCTRNLILQLKNVPQQPLFVIHKADRGGSTLMVLAGRMNVKGGAGIGERLKEQLKWSERQNLAQIWCYATWRAMGVRAQLTA